MLSLRPRRTPVGSNPEHSLYLRPQRMNSIRDMKQADWPAVFQIYVEGIETGIATFESSPPGFWEEWIKGRVSNSTLVSETNQTVTGWAALSPVTSRCVYAGVAEVSIYVAKSQRGKGVGGALMASLVARSEELGFWTLQSQIFADNQATLHLHLNHGFRQVGVRERIGKMTYGPYAGQWRDNLFLERRSESVGR